MPQASKNLFDLAAQTPDSGIAHGQALIRGEAEAGAVFRRGIDLSAGIEIEGRLGGELGEIVVASLEAKGEAAAGVSLTAAVPIDLFDQAGLVARFKAQAAASASVALTLGLELEVLRQLIRERFDPPLEELLEIFLDEVRIGAGMWGRAAFSAEIYGHLILAGSLLETEDQKPGFTASADYGVGWGGGAGMEFAANFDLEDPRRMLGRLADATSKEVLRRAESHFATRPSSEADAAAPALAVLRVLLPLATNTAFQLGFELASANDEDARELAERAVVESFVSRAQEVLLEALLEHAVQELGEILSREGVPDPRDVLSGSELEELRSALVELRDEVFVSLGSNTPADPERWLLAVLEVLEGFEVVLTSGLLTAPIEADARHAVAMLWSAGVLAHRLVEAARDPSASSAFGAALAPVPDDSATAAYVADEIGKPAGSGLTHADLVTFLLGTDPLEGVRDSVPWAADVLDWLEQATGATGGELLQHLLIDLADPDDDAAEALLSFLGSSLASAVAEQIVPDVLDPIKANDPDNEALRLFIDEMVVPTLISLPVVVLPNLPDVDTEEGRMRLREALSAVLLQSIGQFLLSAADLLFHHGLDQGEDELREVGQAVREWGEGSPVLAAIATVAAGAYLPVYPTPGDVDRILQIAADVMGLIDEHEREPLVDAARIALTMGLGTEATRQATLDALTTSDEPPQREDLEVVLGQIEDGAWRIMAYAAPKLLELIAQHYLDGARLIARAVEEGAKAIVAAAEEAVEWLRGQIENLQEEIAKLAERAVKLLAEMLADVQALTAHLRTLKDDVIDTLRAHAQGLLDPLIAGFPKWVKDSLRNLLGLLFDAVKWLLDLPLQLLESVADWVEEVLTSPFTAASRNEQAIRQAVKQRIMATPVLDVKFSLGIPTPGGGVLFPVELTLSGSTVLGAVADAVAADPLYTQTVKGAASAEVEVKAVEAQKSVLQSQLDGTADLGQAEAELASLVPGSPMTVQFITPKPNQLVAGDAELKLRIDGANLSFVEPTLGVPRRVEVRVNSKEYVFAPEHWTEVSGGIELTARVVRTAPPAKEPTLVSGPALKAAQITRLTEIEARLDEEDQLVFTPATRAAAERLGVLDAEELSVRREGDRDVAGEEVELTAVPISVMPAAEAMASPRAATAARAYATAARQDVMLAEPTRLKATGEANVIAPAAMLTPEVFPGEAVVSMAQPEPLAEPVPVDAEGKPMIIGLLGLNAVQVAVSDGSGHEASGSLLFHLGAQPGPLAAADREPEPIKVHVEMVDYAPPGPDWKSERVVLKSNSEVDLELGGWTLRDLARHVYRFPAFRLKPGARVSVWTGPGDDDGENLHWGRRSGVWNNKGDAAVLADAQGREVHRRAYVRGGKRGVPRHPHH